MSASWRLSLPCTRAEAEAVADADPGDAVLVTTEVDEAAGAWRLDAFFEGEPDAAALAAVRALAPGASDTAPEPVPDQDWVTLSQAGLEPIREGRFLVHTAAHPARPEPGVHALLIDAGLAFGTGHHGTTAGCLGALDRLERGGRAFRDVIDLGTGTGLLAFAAARLWPGARVTATDVDPVAVDVSRGNARVNGVALGDGPGQVSLLVADGARAPTIAARAPYDLLVANILAGPLIAMAPEVAALAAPGAAVVLAGLLETQADAVAAAWERCGAREAGRDRRGDWTILLLEAAAGPVAPMGPAAGDRNGWATDGR